MCHLHQEIYALFQMIFIDLSKIMKMLLLNRGFRVYLIIIIGDHLLVIPKKKKRNLWKILKI